MNGKAVHWRAHDLVSGNWRITLEEAAGAIERLNLEDYH